MMGNGNQQWYLYTFATRQQNKATMLMNYLQKQIQPGEQYVWYVKQGVYKFQVHTKLQNLTIPDVQQVLKQNSAQNDKIFNQTKQIYGAKIVIKQIPTLNPMNKPNHNQNMLNNNAKMIMMNNQNMMNMMNQNMINNNAMNIQMMMNQNLMNQNMINMMNQNMINMNQGFNNQCGNPQFNNNSINQQQQALKALDPKNCETQHIKQFFNEETILKKIKDCQTKYPVSNNVRQLYLNWFSDYICRMYKLINVSALGKYKKEQPWQEMLSRKNEKIKFNINDNTVQSDLMDLIKQDFLNGRNHLLDGHDLINDINKTMNLLAQCSLKVYNREINEKGIYRIMAVYEQLCSCLAANPKAFLDRGILGFGSDRDNALRNVVNDNVKVANLKDLIAGAIKILPL